MIDMGVERRQGEDRFEIDWIGSPRILPADNNQVMDAKRAHLII